MKALPRQPHIERSRQSGRFKRTPACDGCGKPVGTAYFTDSEVCGASDGPGFYLCERKLCQRQFEGMTVEQRRVHYTEIRNKRKP